MKNFLVNSGEPVTKEIKALLPIKFTNPFSYIPHKLCIEAAEDLQRFIEGTLVAEFPQELNNGKMFGVLVVESPDGNIGYLAAFSGNLSGHNNHYFFVPPVYDLLNPDEFFKIGEREISAINKEIETLENSPEYLCLISEIDMTKSNGEAEIRRLKEHYKAGKKERDLKRERFYRSVSVNSSTPERNSPDYAENELLLQRESQFQKAEIKRAEKRLVEQLEPLNKRLNSFVIRINSLKTERKERSAALQNRIFENFTFMNGLGERASLLQIFKGLPPAGAGECAAPKLLQYAYLNNYKPIAMGEFWWGNSPAGEIRRHCEFYPSCKSKCAPILGFMLQGLNIEERDFHTTYGLQQISVSEQGDSPASLFNPVILYEDEYILAVDKPAGMLSAPGKSKHEYSVEEWVSARTPAISEVPGVIPGPRVTHRLDMHTSGVLLLAKSDDIYKEMQRKFACREVEKCYVAVLDGIVSPDKCGSGVTIEQTEPCITGTISLPLISDYEHRPSQKVDFEMGKEAITKFKIVKIADDKSYVEFYPVTGRTHQLRVHAAHTLGLNAPIVGDLLYGAPAKRLMLHAKSITFKHPISGEIMKIVSPD